MSLLESRLFSEHREPAGGIYPRLLMNVPASIGVPWWFLKNTSTSYPFNAWPTEEIWETTMGGPSGVYLPQNHRIVMSGAVDGFGGDVVRCQVTPLQQNAVTRNPMSVVVGDTRLELMTSSV